MKLRTVLAILLFVTAIPAMAQTGSGSQPWKKQVNLDIGLQIPGGDNAEGLSTGWGAAATFYYQLLTRQTFLSASAGYMQLPFEGSNSLNLTVIPLLVGLRYNFALTGFQPYIGAEFGAYLSSVSVTDGSVTLDQSDTDIGIAPKVGFRYPLSPGFDLDASVKWHNIFVENSSFSILGLNVGVAYTIE